jgi:hypothetical protein
MKAVSYIQHLENENELLTDEISRLNNNIEILKKINLDLNDSDSDSDSVSDSSSDSDSVSVNYSDLESISSMDKVVVDKIIDVVVDVKQNDNLLLAINSVLNTSIILLTVYSVFSLLRKY